MPRMADENRELWLWLLADAGAWTVADLSIARGMPVERVFSQVSGMAAKGHLEKLAPLSGSRRLRYAVTGTCRVPLGMHVAEVQA
jgi:hypothetical protein